jgi:hypothetical protein
MTFPFTFTETRPGPSFIGISPPSSEKMALPLRLAGGKHSSIGKRKVDGDWFTFTIPECRSPESAKVSKWRDIAVSTVPAAGKEGGLTAGNGRIYTVDSRWTRFLPACLESFREQGTGERWLARRNFRNQQIF